MRRNLSLLAAAVLTVVLTAAPAIGQTTRTRISVGGNGVGGVYYLYAGALSTIINEKGPAAQATVEVCPGSSVEHVVRMQINDIQIGPAMNDVVFQAVKGVNRFNKPHDKVRTLFTMYPAELQGASLEKDGLTTPKALIGKRVSIGNPGTGTSVMTAAVFEALGIDIKSMKIQNLNWNEGAQAIRNNSLDVQFGAIAAPAPFIMDLSASHKVALVNFSDEELAKIQAKYAYYAPLTIKAGTYPDIKIDVKTPGIWNSMLATADLSDELAYQITKAAYENIPTLQKVYKGADWATPENTIKFAVAPLHPGAVRYYKEKGIAVPDNLMPK
jgi:uncharacterized protein